VGNSLITLNDKRTTAFVTGKDDSAFAVIREAHPDRVVIYESVEAFVAAEGGSFDTLEVKILENVRHAILQCFVRALESDPRFREVVQQLKEVLPAQSSSWATSRVDKKGTHHYAFATGDTDIIQSSGDAVVLPKHWFYAVAG